MGKHPVITAPLLFHEKQRCTSVSLNFSPLLSKTSQSHLSFLWIYSNIQFNVKYDLLWIHLAFGMWIILDSDSELHFSITLRFAGQFCSCEVLCCALFPRQSCEALQKQHLLPPPSQAYACPCFLSHNHHLASSSAYDLETSGTNHLNVKGHAVKSLLNVQWKKEM